MRRWASVLIRGVVQETPAPRRPACPARESGPAVRDKRTKAAPGDEPRVLPPSVCPVCPHETSYMIRRGPRSPLSPGHHGTRLRRTSCRRRESFVDGNPGVASAVASADRKVCRPFSSVSRCAAIFFISFISNELIPLFDYADNAPICLFPKLE